MQRTHLIRFFFLLIAVQWIATPVFAYRRENRIPLVGCRGHYSASGSARYFEIRKQQKEKDREELVIEIQNVPLPRGTILLVYVSDELIGSITLDAKRTGSIKLQSETRKFVPKIDAGTSVIIKTIEGQNVIW